MMFSPC